METKELCLANIMQVYHVHHVKSLDKSFMKWTTMRLPAKQLITVFMENSMRHT